MAVEAIIFDFDGVIVDTETPDFELWREFYRNEGHDLSVDLWITRVGTNEGTGFDPVTYYEKLTGKTLDDSIRSAQIQRYFDRCDSQPLLAGVQAMIHGAAARGIKLAVASSSYHDWVTKRLAQHGLLPYFSCIRTRGDVKLGKPAPDLYLSAIECLGVPVKRCIAIEDSPNGMKAALAAGLRCIAVPNELTSRLPAPEVALTVGSLGEFTLDHLLEQF